jgi:hypothetical protein
MLNRADGGSRQAGPAPLRTCTATLGTSRSLTANICAMVLDWVLDTTAEDLARVRGVTSQYSSRCKFAHYALYFCDTYRPPSASPLSRLARLRRRSSTSKHVGRKIHGARRVRIQGGCAQRYCQRMQPAPRARPAAMLHGVCANRATPVSWVQVARTIVAARSPRTIAASSTALAYGVCFAVCERCPACRLTLQRTD